MVLFFKAVSKLRITDEDSLRMVLRRVVVWGDSPTLLRWLDLLVLVVA